MSSAYRIFINGNRVATAVTLGDGSVLQTYPERDDFPDLNCWVFWSFWENRNGATSYTLGYPDGSYTTFFQERYTLFHGGKCVSAGLRIGSLYMQRYPYHDVFMSRDGLLAERAPHFGVDTSLRVRTKAPDVVPAKPKPRKERRILTEDERDVLRARLANARAVKQARAAARAIHRYGPDQYVSEREARVEFLPNPLAPAKPTYWTADTPGLHPSMRMLLSVLGPVERSGEGCDCGEC